jgi:hypothetical protein
MKDDYEVGYKKPPRQHQFKPRHERNARPGGGGRKESNLDVASWLDAPLKVKRQGKLTNMHPHEAAMLSLGKRALKGERSAAKEFLKQCELAGLLTAKQLEQTHGVFAAPRGVDLSIARVMIETYGLPTWGPDEYAAIKEEFERDQARIDELYENFLRDLNNAQHN